MTERPILFSAPMVRAILAGTKTQTRRVVKSKPLHPAHASIGECGYMHGPWSNAAGEMQEPIVWTFGSQGVGKRDPMNFFVEHTVRCPYGVPGDTLWVRESFAPRYFDNGAPGYMADWTSAAADVVPQPKWKPSIHMPRALSRITLRVTSVRVERVQDISEEDIVAEGVAPERWLQAARAEMESGHVGVMREGVRALWETLWIDINGAESWEANPWVWVVGFERVEVAA